MINLRGRETRLYAIFIQYFQSNEVNIYGGLGYKSIATMFDRHFAPSPVYSAPTVTRVITNQILSAQVICLSAVKYLQLVTWRKCRPVCNLHFCTPDETSRYVNLVDLITVFKKSLVDSFLCVTATFLFTYLLKAATMIFSWFKLQKVTVEITNYLFNNEFS